MGRLKKRFKILAVTPASRKAQGRDLSAEIRKRPGSSGKKRKHAMGSARSAIIRPQGKKNWVLARGNRFSVSKVRETGRCGTGKKRRTSQEIKVAVGSGTQ